MPYCLYILTFAHSSIYLSVCQTRHKLHNWFSLDWCSRLQTTAESASISDMTLHISVHNYPDCRLQLCALQTRLTPGDNGRLDADIPPAPDANLAKNQGGCQKIRITTADCYQKQISPQCPVYNYNNCKHIMIDMLSKTIYAHAEKQLNNNNGSRMVITCVVMTNVKYALNFPHSFPFENVATSLNYALDIYQRP